MKVPFLDLRQQHAPLEEEILEAIRNVMHSNAFAGGTYVERFERDFAKYCQCSEAIGVGNGTDALWFALLALGVGPGDEVITVPSTFMATAEAITYCGARPVFVDIDERTYTMDPFAIESVITLRTKAILPVHLFGQMADMDAIMGIADKHGIPVVEDACQAHGAESHGRRAGSVGQLGCFSFYPGKNLGAMGEAGAVVTQDPELADKIRVLRDHGQSRKYHHDVVGWNGRMDGMQAAVLEIKLKHLDRWNTLRRTHARTYGHALESHAEWITPFEAVPNRHVYHVYALRVQERDRMLKTLQEEGISCGIHYPVPVHLQKAYAHLGLKRGSFPVAERCADEFLSLPMFPEMTSEQISHVIARVKAVHNQSVLV